jgi:putative transposase
VIHRPILGKIKTDAMSRESTGKEFAAILADDGVAASERLPPIESITGIDVGLKEGGAASSGKKTGHPIFLKRALQTLQREQQALSRKIEVAKKRCMIASKPLAKRRDFFGRNIAKDRKTAAHAMSASAMAELILRTRCHGNWRTQTKRLPPGRRTRRA